MRAYTHYLLGWMALFLLIGGPACQAAEPMNVLFIAVDDLRPELGCYGVNYVQTPNIDQLARQGVVFSHHYVQVPTCGASRAAMLTGRSPATSGIRGGNNALYDLPREQQPGAQTLPELFRRSGYHTVCIGKISHTPDGRVFAYNGNGDGRDELPHAWNELATPLGAWQRGWGVFFAYPDGKHREDGKGHHDLMDFTAEQDDDLPDGLNASAAIAKLAELKDRDEPFFLAVGFYKPHLPFVAPRQDWEAVQDWDVPPPAHPELYDSPFAKQPGEFYGYRMPFEKSRPLAPDSAMQARRAYLACVRYTDRQVGRVLDALEEQGLADNTIVVLWGDHGWHLGEYGLWGKHQPFERAVHSPLIIRAPQVVEPGRTSDALAEAVDIYPTLIELAQPSFTTTQHELDGVSLAPILRKEREQVRPAAISYWNNAVSVRTTTHRLIFRGNRNNPQDVELYDLREGPDAVRLDPDEHAQEIEAMLKLAPGK